MPKKVETVPFSVEHIDVMDIRIDEVQGIMSVENARERFELMSTASIEAKTFIADGRIIFAAGFIEIWPGVVDCWMLPSIYVKTVRIEFCKILKAYVRDIMDRKGCHRVQASTQNDETHSRFMKFLGFEREGLMRKYTHNKQDYVMYARTR